MKPVRFVARILYYISLILCTCYTLAGLYVAFATGFRTSSFRLIEEGKKFIVSAPFGDRPYFIGDNYPGYMIQMVALLLLYGLFFWLLSKVFITFTRKKLFTQQGIAHLQRFYIVNFTVPSLAYIILLITKEDTEDIFMLIMLHAIIGVFAYFIAAIFKQGVLLQNEQDLYI
ncbi:MAG: DUF2975 domain-containing protein [Ferruginibacter sp.]